MPQIEVDESEFLRSKQAREFVEAIYKNPKARRKLLEAQKEVKPDDPAVKELDQPDPNEQRFSALEKELAEERKARHEAEEKRERDEKISTLQRQKTEGIAQLRSRGWTDEGLKGVEDIMEKKGILDPLDAAAIFERDHPPQAPLMPNGTGSWNFLGDIPTSEDGDLKKLIESRGENNPLLDKMARDALMEVRGTRR